jgi:O-antigen/teichoic acid export membrane protein
MSARTRLITGFSATAVGPLITALVQVVSVPLFLRAWGPHLYGEWLVMSAVPAYLSVTDIGFGSVAGNDMAMRVAASDRDGALKTFQSTFVLVAAISLVVAAIGCCVIFVAPVTEWLHIGMIDGEQARLILMFLSIYALATIQGSVLLSAFRSDGQYSLGVSGLNAVRLLETAAMLLALGLHARPVSVAFAATSVRIVGTSFLYAVLRNKLPWIRLGCTKASFQCVKELARPAVAFMAFPAGNAISIQGMTLLIGILLGPVAVATFNPMRTLSRFAYQVIDSIKNALWPELSTAYGKHNWALARKLHRSCCQIAFWFAAVAVIALAIAGPGIFRIWTQQRVVMNVQCFYVLLIVVVASSLWNTSSAVSIAANLHQQVALQYLLGTAGSLLVAFVLMPRFQMLGAALALLAADIWMGCFVVRGSNELLNDDTGDFIRSMFSLKRLKLLVAN